MHQARRSASLINWHSPPTTNMNTNKPVDKLGMPLFIGDKVEADDGKHKKAGTLVEFTKVQNTLYAKIRWEDGFLTHLNACYSLTKTGAGSIATPPFPPGSKVTYAPTGEKGIVKSTPNSQILAFVVFGSDEVLENFQTRTAQLTKVEDLVSGW